MRAEKRRSILIILLVVAMMGAGIRSGAARAQDGLVTITIINTADEHGWLLPYVPFGAENAQGGAAVISGWWKAHEGYDPDTMLLLSSGDNWTGPSISTWFQGEPMVAAFNMMEYDASTIGNHEFDFGRDVLNKRFAEANYSYLGANIRDAATGNLADFALPYVIETVQGVPVGIIGLTTRDTVRTTHPRNILDLEFVDYTETLEQYVPEMREQGAAIIVLLAHVCTADLVDIATYNPELVDAIFAGHCNERVIRDVNGVSIMGSGWAWRTYGRLNITYDQSADKIVSFDQKLDDIYYPAVAGPPVTPDAEIQLLVDEWKLRADEVLAQEIGYTTNGLPQREWAQANWITDAWLWAYPAADVAVTNWGGLRQAVPAGPITISDVVGVLPFENRIYAVAVTGAELARNLKCCGGAVAGIRYSRVAGDVEIEFLDGRPFDPAATYNVLINDFMYFGGDGYLFGQQDPAAYDTGIQWRQPVIDWMLSLNTSPDEPLENYLDVTPRER